MKWAVVFTKGKPKEKDSIVVPLFKEETKKWRSEGFGYLVDDVSLSLKTGDFEGKLGETHVRYLDGDPKRLFLLGLGERKHLDTAEFLEAMTKLGKTASGMNVGSMTIMLPEPLHDLVPYPVRLIIDGFSRGTYRFDRYGKKPDRTKQIKGMMVLLESEDALKDGLKDRKVGEALAQGCRIMMDLSNEPPNVATPDFVAKQVQKSMNKLDGNVKVKVLKPSQLEKLGLNLVLAVGQASANTQRMAIMEYRGGRSKDRPIVLVGKGVTFDGGGMSIKTSEGMKNMRLDMSGASAVIGAIHAAASLKLKVNVIGITPLVENIIGPTSYKVSDIIRSYSGKSVEVLNTDAEGRLILADALAYAADMKPSEILDIATLTGASIIAVGKVAAAVMGNDETVMDTVRSAAAASGERVWELPMWNVYDQLVRSKVADVKNISGKRDAGCIVGAKFLEPFVDGTPWVHIDMAPTFVNEDNLSTGYGVSLLVNYLMERQ